MLALAMLGGCSSHSTARQPAAVPPYAIASVNELERVARRRSYGAWQQSLAEHLAQYKRYPLSAFNQRQQGTVVLIWVMSRDGRVLSVEIEKSSGVEELDQEAKALIWRAQPLPSAPSSVQGVQFKFTVPVEFNLGR